MIEETVLFQAKLHWIIFSIPTLLLIGGIMILFYFPIAHLPAFVFMAFGAIWWIMVLITYRFSLVSIQSNQLTLQTGLFVRQTVNIPLSKIESLDIRQSVLGNILDYGTLMITGTGGTRYSIDNLHRPLTCRRYIETLIAK